MESGKVLCIVIYWLIELSYKAIHITIQRRIVFSNMSSVHVTVPLEIVTALLEYSNFISTQK